MRDSSLVAAATSSEWQWGEFFSELPGARRYLLQCLEGNRAAR